MRYFSIVSCVSVFLLAGCGGKRTVTRADEGAAGSMAGQVGTGAGGLDAGGAGQGGATTAGTAGASGAGGSAGVIDTSECISVDVGQAFATELSGESLYVQTYAWLGRSNAGLWLALHPPVSGEFDFDTPVNGDFSLCTECLAISTFADDGPVRAFVARYGKLVVEQTPEDGNDHSAGSFENVVLYEATIEDDVATTLPDGDCLLIEAGSWETASCEPGTSCMAEFQCVPTYTSTGGICSAIGGNGLGDICSDRIAGTDCSEGLVCRSGICRDICDFWAQDPGCPVPEMCGSDGLCVPPEQDVAVLGEVCTFGTNWLCGGDGARYAGRCIDSVEGAICRQTCRTTTFDCVPGETCEPAYADADYGSCTLSSGGTGGAGGSAGAGGGGAGSGGEGGV